jgi:hypothetical protein
MPPPVILLVAVCKLCLQAAQAGASHIMEMVVGALALDLRLHSQVKFLGGGVGRGCGWVTFPRYPSTSWPFGSHYLELFLESILFHQKLTLCTLQ